jgi:iron complex transport system substrate-binding protein
MIEMTGGVNVAGGIQLRNADVSIETIIGWNPDVIFIWGNAQYGVRDILESSQWKFVKAVREGRVYKAPEWSTWSPRLALIVLWMSMKTYPDLYKDLDFQTAADDFYRKVFKMPYGKSGVR